MKLISETLPAGRYYVGDLCYVMHNEWDEFCDNLDPGQYTLKDGRTYAWCSTTYGDGSYEDQLGNSYCVDAGLIGVIKESDIEAIPDNVFGKHQGRDWDLGFVHDFPEDFQIFYDEGKIVIGHLTIDTDPSYEEDEEDDSVDELQEWADFDPEC